MRSNLREDLKRLCRSLKLDNMQSIEEVFLRSLKERVRELPSSEIIDVLSEPELDSLRVVAQELQFDIDNSRTLRTHDHAIRHKINKDLPPPRKPVLASNWYGSYKNPSHN